MPFKNPEDDPVDPEPTGAGRVIKKGLGAWSEMTSPDELSQLHVGWYYNWRPFPKIPPAPAVEFVPMFWSGEDVTPENLAKVGESAATHVLGFNEPDLEGQSNMTPEACLELWPRLISLEKRLGSPAPAKYTWLEKFMAEAKRRDLRVDFVCLHRYPDISNPAAVDEVGAMIEEVRKKYGLPIWLTESGAADVTAWRQPQLSKPTAEMAQSYMKGLVAMLERLPYVERYAWFADRTNKEYVLGSIFDPNASGLTEIGEVYRDAG